MTASATEDGHTVPRRKHRALSAWMLLYWLLFQFLSTFQPCCVELPAAASGRYSHHAALGQHSPYEQAAAHAHAKADSAWDQFVGHLDELIHGRVDAERYCVSPDGTNSSMPDAMVSTSIGFELEFFLVGIVLLVLYRISRTIKARPQTHHDRSPPEPVYLSTLRLRI